MIRAVAALLIVAALAVKRAGRALLRLPNPALRCVAWPLNYHDSTTRRTIDAPMNLGFDSPPPCHLRQGAVSAFHAAAQSES